MTHTIKHTYFLILLFFSILFFSSCKKQQKPEHEDFSVTKKNINHYPLEQHIAKWDSLINLHQDDTLSGYIYFERGQDYFYLNQNKKALEDLQKAKLIFEKKNNKKMLSKVYVILGGAYIENGEKEKATRYILKGLELIDEKNKKFLIKTYDELSHIYYLNKDFDKTIKYLLKAAQISKETRDSSALGIAYNNIAVVYLEQGYNKEAVEYFEKVLKYYDLKKAPPHNLIVIYVNLGTAYMKLNEKEKAFEYFDKAKKIARQKNIKSKVLYLALSSVYESNNQLDSAIYYIRKAIKLIDNKTGDESIELHDKLIRLNLMQKNDTSILKLINIKDSLNKLKQEKNNKEKLKSIEENLRILNQQKELNQAVKINKKNRIIFIFIIIMFVLGLIISFQFNRFDVLKHKQELIVLKQKILRSQMNPHFIFNVLSSIQNSLLEKNPIESATYLSKFAKLMRQNFDYIGKRQIKLKEELDMIRNYLDTQKFRFKDKFDYQINVDNSLTTGKYLIPPMILQPFVENAIKHGFANISYKGLISINVLKKDDKICFEIIDNGTGYNPDKQDDKEHALDIFKKRLFLCGKDVYESFKIIRLKPGTKVEFCFKLIKA